MRQTVFALVAESIRRQHPDSLPASRSNRNWTTSDIGCGPNNQFSPQTPKPDPVCFSRQRPRNHRLQPPQPTPRVGKSEGGHQTLRVNTSRVSEVQTSAGKLRAQDIAMKPCLYSVCSSRASSGPSSGDLLASEEPRSSLANPNSTEQRPSLSGFHPSHSIFIVLEPTRPFGPPRWTSIPICRSFKVGASQQMF